MTTTLPDFGPVSGDALASFTRKIPGSLWEREADRDTQRLIRETGEAYDRIRSELDRISADLALIQADADELPECPMHGAGCLTWEEIRDDNGL